MNEVVLPGHVLCPGCGGAIAQRIVFKAIGDRKVVLYGGGVCASGGSRNAQVPSFNLHFSGVASASTGIVHALKVRGRSDVKVIEFSGDGGAVDIGFGTLSATASRNENILFVVNDNEAYMNTGIQKSSATPWGAWTTTTPLGRSDGQKKDMIMIMAQHRIPYVASVSVGYPQDFERKIRKAIDIEGFRYVHVLEPCATGWRFPAERTVEIARLAVQTGIFNLVEIDNGKLKISVKPRERRPVNEYLELQGRFRQLSDTQKEFIQEVSDRNWQRLVDLEGAQVAPEPDLI
jgi:pyruvate/2-oxoacid:ferredoxin oxidoreductase beta subunit